MKKFVIAPSLLSANFAKLGEEAEAVLNAGADMLHLDVMDHHYVPNLTVGPMVCAALRAYGITAPIDVHLMTKPVDPLIIEFAKAGATNITFHPDATPHVDRSINLIHEHGCKAGLAINPATSLHCLDFIIDKLDLVLIMSVNPGFGGQKFIPGSIKKIQKCRQMLNDANHDILLAVDGGVTVNNISKIAQAGADMFIAGSAIFNCANRKEVIDLMREELCHVTTNQEQP